MPENRVEFPGTAFGPISVPAEAELGLVLTAVNSPLLFGCRSGICGTCLVEVTSFEGELIPPNADESESLEIYAEGNPLARLACQLRLNGPVRMRKIDPA